MDFAFVVRGDNLEPRFAAWDKIYALMGGLAARIVSHPSAIGGSAISGLAQDNVSATGSGVAYTGRHNAGRTKERTVFASFCLTTEGQYSVIYSSRSSGTNPGQLFELLVGMNAGQGTLRVYITSLLGWVAKDKNFNIPTVIGQWHDLVVSYTGDTAANGLKIWFDGVLLHQEAANYPQELPWNPLVPTTVSFFYGYMWSQSQHYLQEVGSVDGIWTPADFELEDGTFGLNGASRASYIKCDDFSGARVPQTRHVYMDTPPYYLFGERYDGTAAKPTYSSLVPEEKVDYGYPYTHEDTDYVGKLRSFGGFGNLRQFLNFLLGEIGAASLTEDEWQSIVDGGLENPDFEYNNATYTALATVLIERGSGTDVDKIRYYFLAKGAELTPLSDDGTGILLGGQVDSGESDPSAQSNMLLGGVIEDNS